MKSKTFKPKLLAASVMVALCASGAAFAKGKPTTGEAGANNLSIPVILPEGTGTSGVAADALWYFANITDPATQCTTGVLPGQAVPSDKVCYYDGSQVWWLSQRQTSLTITDGNFWKSFSPIDPDPNTKTVVTAIDWGDLLESSPNLNSKRIRTEVSLLKDASGSTDEDSDYSLYMATLPQVLGTTTGAAFVPPCNKPTSVVPSLGCFAALNMSGAVPGTDQSINEIQGTDFGLDTNSDPPVSNHLTATGTLIDPRTVKTLTAANDKDGNAVVSTLTGFDATIYSECARLVIQRITGNAPQVVWDPLNHRWGPIAQVALPVVDLKAWQANNDYSAEINAGGSMIYGYNWSTQGLDAGTYRLTFVLDNGISGAADPTSEHCNVKPNTKFTTASLVANPGEVAVAKIIEEGSSLLGGDQHVSSLSYIDVSIRTSGGGSGGGGPRGPR